MNGAVPGAVLRAAAAFDVEPAQVTPLGGATGTTFAAGPHVLRIGGTARLDREVRAMAAASVAVPVPQVLGTTEVGDDGDDPTAALLLSRLPGVAAGDLDDVSVAGAHHRGTVCGQLHCALAGVRAPEGLRAVAPGDALLHLDLHPFNVLVDADGVTGVLDWANAAAGPADLDRARSASILGLDPTAVELSRDERFAALVRGWSEAAGFADLSVAARAWACRRMLHDLRERHPPSALVHVRDLLAALEGGTED